MNPQKTIIWLTAYHDPTDVDLQRRLDSEPLVIIKTQTTYESLAHLVKITPHHPTIVWINLTCLSESAREFFLLVSRRFRWVSIYTYGSSSDLPSDRVLQWGITAHLKPSQLFSTIVHPSPEILNGSTTTSSQPKVSTASVTRNSQPVRDPLTTLDTNQPNQLLGLTDFLVDQMVRQSESLESYSNHHFHDDSPHNLEASQPAYPPSIVSEQVLAGVRPVGLESMTPSQPQLRRSTLNVESLLSPEELEALLGENE